MTIVPPQQWRVVGDRLTDDESFIPMTPRDFAVFRKFQEGPTEEERMRTKKLVAQQKAKRLADMAALRERHEFLMKFSDSPAVSALLAQHAPHEGEEMGTVWQECHGCPSYHDYDPFGDGSEQYHAWPCPTWQTISDSTP